MDQRPVQVGRTTAHSVATSVNFEKDPTPNSFQGIDLEDMEVHNRVEGKIDNTVDLKAVDNLAVDTGLGVDNPEAHTDTGVADLEVRKIIDFGEHTDMKVDLGVRTGTGVDPGAHIGPGVDLEECIVP